MKIPLQFTRNLREDALLSLLARYNKGALLQNNEIFMGSSPGSGNGITDDFLNTQTSKLSALNPETLNPGGYNEIVLDVPVTVNGEHFLNPT